MSYSYYRGPAPRKPFVKRPVRSYCPACGAPIFKANKKYCTPAHNVLRYPNAHPWTQSQWTEHERESRDDDAHESDA